MRKVSLWNEGWSFDKDGEQQEQVILPHTWNQVDGQDGGNDYYRGVCCYHKSFSIEELTKGHKVFVEFRGVNASARVLINGVLCGAHDGGYSTFRVELTDHLKEENLLEVLVDNSPNERVYPQKADFTFYGGIYRDVYLIEVEKSHFALDYFGSKGLKITPVMVEDGAVVTLEAFITGTGSDVSFSIEGVGTVSAEVKDQHALATMHIKDVRLWDGMKDPYLYKVKAQLGENGKTIDQVEDRFGCRSYAFDSETGFHLNGHPYPLHGVSRHQDRKGFGNALTKEQHEEDLQMIVDIGANAIRLAHYQHDQYIYERLDELGIIAWAEIPYISEHLPLGRANTISQMTELVVQNFHHSSIICWALSNEITVTGITEDLVDNHRELNDLVHRLDPMRVTAMANVFLLETDHPLTDLPDIMSYNLYYGWYVGETEENDRFFDAFHEKYPEKIIGLAEYGADTNYRFQSPDPVKGDYTEQYQCLYHEHMLEMFRERPYIWSTFVWNMFDFGADGREEAEDPGVNHKGLVSFDRTLKKDAYFLYKAWWSNQPFLHICGRRYVDRSEEITQIKVYSNLEEVALYVDGVFAESQKGSHVFTFQVKMTGIHLIEAVAGACKDEIRIRKTDTPNPSYHYANASVKNWFDEPGMEILEGFYSIKDTIGEIRKSPVGKALIDAMMAQAAASFGDVAKNVQGGEAMERMVNNSTVESILRMGGSAIRQEMIVELNRQLNKIEKYSD